MHKAALPSCALSLVEILEQTKVIIINPFSWNIMVILNVGQGPHSKDLADPGSFLRRPETRRPSKSLRGRRRGWQAYCIGVIELPLLSFDSLDYLDVTCFKW